uniref:Uncharacterized protein n=1 Tax=Maylandia zebra TaxID=106582 RepID=A0A3P9C2B2_9CICH
ITREASLSARDAFISPSAAITLALASRLASASAAMALWSWRGSFTSLISTLSTLIPQSSVASSSDDCMLCAISSRSDRISARFLVPSTFLRVVWASRRVAASALVMLATARVAFWTR